MYDNYVEKWPFMVIFLYNLYIFVWMQKCCNQTKMNKLYREMTGFLYNLYIFVCIQHDCLVKRVFPQMPIMCYKEVVIYLLTNCYWVNLFFSPKDCKNTTDHSIVATIHLVFVLKTAESSEIFRQPYLEIVRVDIGQPLDKHDGSLGVVDSVWLLLFIDCFNNLSMIKMYMLILHILNFEEMDTFCRVATLSKLFCLPTEEKK